MYLWVIIATFITILYSYNISVRADLDRVHAETKAGVVVTKFFAQHNAVKDYFNSQAPSKIGQTYVPYFPGDGINSEVCENGSGKEACSIGEDIKPYLPMGYSEDPKVTTKVYCFNNGDKSNNCSSGGGPSCCSNEFAGIYVVSYRIIPSRWINKSTGMPNADLLGYMAKTRGFGKSFGYTDKVDGKLVLSGGYMAKNYDDFTGGGLEAELPDGGLDTEMPGVGVGGGSSGSNPHNPFPHDFTLPEDPITGEFEAGQIGSQGEMEFQYHEIFQAVITDPDFTSKGCDKDDVHCFYAIQQIYD